MSVSEWIARQITLPAHEWLRRRPTLRELQTLTVLAAQTAEIVAFDGQERLRGLLRFAARFLPYYAEQFAGCGVDPDAEYPLAELAKLPVLEKTDIRANADRMVCRSVPGGPIACSSGGTTGDTLRFYIDRIRQAQPLAARLLMQRRFGVRPGDRRVYFWGSPIESKASGLKRARDRLINEQLLDAFEMSPPQIAAHLARIRAFRPRVIYGYPSALALLAQHAAANSHPRDFSWLRLVVLTGEEVTPDQLAQVREGFGCRVAGEYGSREVGLIAHECPRGQMHVITPHVLVEILAHGRAVPAGRCGEILCTTLNTRAQPLIRYRIGDVGALLPDRCECGLPFPLLRIVGGKITGFIVLPDGRLCHGAITSHMLRDQPGIVEFKTYQRTVKSFEVLLVVDRDFQPATIPLVQRRYRELFGPQIRVDCRIVEQIPPDPSGKRRYVVSDVAPDGGRFEVVRPPIPTGSGVSAHGHG